MKHKWGEERKEAWSSFQTYRVLHNWGWVTQPKPFGSAECCWHRHLPAWPLFSPDGLQLLSKSWPVDQRVAFPSDSWSNATGSWRKLQVHAVPLKSQTSAAQEELVPKAPPNIRQMPIQALHLTAAVLNRTIGSDDQLLAVLVQPNSVRNCQRVRTVSHQSHELSVTWKGSGCAFTSTASVLCQVSTPVHLSHSAIPCISTQK